MKPNAKPRRRASTGPSTLHLYSGRMLLGTMVRRGRAVEAFTASGETLGVFSNLRVAAEAVSASANQAQVVE